MGVCILFGITILYCAGPRSVKLVAPALACQRQAPLPGRLRSGSSEAQSPLEGNRSKHALKRLSVLCGSQPRTFIEAQL